jgi:ribosomal protein S27AE
MMRNTQKLAMNACPRCGGAAYLEDPHEDDWRCLQCARTVPSPFAKAAPAPRAIFNSPATNRPAAA